MLRSRFATFIFSRIINIILFYLGWVYIVINASQDQPIRGGVVALLIVIFHLAICQNWVKELVLVIITIVLGFILETIFINAHILKYAGHLFAPSSIPPIWMLGLYAIFATTIDRSLFWLRPYPIISIFFGAIGGAISYFAGAELHALIFTVDRLLALSIIAIGWMILLPILVFLSKKLDDLFGYDN